MAPQADKRDTRTTTDATPTQSDSEAAQEAARPDDGAEYARQKQIAQEEAGWAPPSESGNPEAPSGNTAADSTPPPRK